jgi:hypothetical protein
VTHILCMDVCTCSYVRLGRQMEVLLLPANAQHTSKCSVAQVRYHGSLCDVKTSSGGRVPLVPHLQTTPSDASTLDIQTCPCNT